MNKSRIVKLELNKFESTGILTRDSELIKLAIEKYESIIQSSYYIPEMGMIRSQCIHKKQVLEDILTARGE